jgi:hypothetical protein
LGKVGIRMRGNWNSSTAYEVLDAVSYNNGLYIAKQGVPANTLPTDTTYWQLALDNTALVYKAGDTIANTNYVLVGRAAQSAKVFNNFRLPLSRVITASNVTITLNELFLLDGNNAINIKNDVDSYSATIGPTGIIVGMNMKSTYTMPALQAVTMQLQFSVAFS